MNTNFCDFLANVRNAYILGLLAADSYWWSSSLGVSSVEQELQEKFHEFARALGFSEERIKVSKSGNHLYVNSRPLLRAYKAALPRIRDLEDRELIRAYIAGRFDGDGCLNRDLRRDCRIVYGEKAEKEEAFTDRMLLRKIGVMETSINYYRTSGTYCLYVFRGVVGVFLEAIAPYSIKLQKLVFMPRRDLIPRSRFED
ncbi:MAG: hypothetical protein ABIB12_02950 [Patescibacteria group bacterium]